MDLGIKGKVVLVTGSGQGIGKAIALAFANEGAKVVISDVNEENGLATKKEAETLGAQAIFVKADVSKEDDVKKLFETIKNELGTIDILVNNAGISPKGHDFYDIPHEEFAKVLDVNLTGSYLCACAAYEQMKSKGWGRIINMASSSGLYGANVAGVHYASSKGGIIAMTKTLGKRMGPEGITVNCVAPGRINTPMTIKTPFEVAEKIRQQIPLRRNGEPEEVASVILFLASNMASYMTCYCLEIGGGWVS